jgi:ethanolamine ammonia-lyase small subunit
MARRPRSKADKPARSARAAPGKASFDPWTDLRELTAARIGLARSGASLATGPLLELRLAHARARDAVHAPFDEERLVLELGALGLPVLQVTSAAKDRAQYLLRPDLGRQLASANLSSLHAEVPTIQFNVVFVITEGLSARAMAHAKPLLAEVIPVLTDEGWKIAPLVVARLGRVAIGDTVAVAMNADLCVVLIGERPGLSAPDSMGAYLTWRPGPDTTDAQRNCISNIRPDGIAYVDAAFKLLHILRAMRAQQISGVALKDTTDRLAIT